MRYRYKSEALCVSNSSALHSGEEIGCPHTEYAANLSHCLQVFKTILHALIHGENIFIVHVLALGGVRPWAL